MKGLLHWFKRSSKMKRWIFLMLIGIILACYGIAEILVLKEVSFGEIAKIAGIFVLGFVCIVLGLIGANKRTLELLVEASDDRMENKKNVNVKSLIFNRNIYDKGPNIVVIGGGTGLNTVLTGLKNYTSNITAIVTVSDYGEINSNSRKELNMLPMNDIRDSMVALSTKGEEMEKVFNHEFKEGRLRGLSFSDIYFRAMCEVNQDFTKAVMQSNEVLNIVGRVLPVTLDEMTICAELENGYVIREKSKIPELVSERVTKINRIFLDPANCRPAPGVVDAIKNADCIIIGPGSLYTNVIPNLLINSVAKALKESTAIKVYISNIMTDPGQTDNYTVSDHLNAIISHCGQGVIDYCIYDTGEIIPEFIKKYNMQGQDLVEQDIEKVKGIKFLQRDLSSVDGGLIRHDPNLVAKSIIELICDDLKFQDKQNDPQYLMLNNKLKQDKRINKLKKRSKKQNIKGANAAKKAAMGSKRKSKFSNKYSERIASIRESDSKINIKEQLAKTEKKKKPQNIVEKRSDFSKPKAMTKNSNIVKEINTSFDKKTAIKPNFIEPKIQERPREVAKVEKKSGATSTNTTHRKKTAQEIREEMLRKLGE